jgi:hypothetical protein
LVETRSNNGASLKESQWASIVKDSQDNSRNVIDLIFRKERRASGMHDSTTVLFVSLPVSMNCVFIDPKELPNHTERDGVILAAQDPACVETLFPDACARGENIVAEKG